MPPTNIENEIKISSQIFLDIIWPVIKGCVGGGDIVPVEQVTDNNMANKLDMYAGIDAWHVLDNKQGMRGIASRVQYYSKSWDTFTIRKDVCSGSATEYDKRMQAIYDDGDWLFPSLTVQSYVASKTNPELVSTAVTLTRDLFDYIKNDGSGCYTKLVIGGNVMLVIPWENYAASGKKIRIFRNDS